MGAALIYSNTCDFACCDFQSVSNCQLYFEYFSLEKKNAQMIMSVSSMFVQNRKCQRLVYSHFPILTMTEINYCIRCFFFFFPSVCCQMEPIKDKGKFGIMKGPLSVFIVGLGRMFKCTALFPITLQRQVQTFLAIKIKPCTVESKSLCVWYYCIWQCN